jgi:hypothetical protein
MKPAEKSEAEKGPENVPSMLFNHIREAGEAGGIHGNRMKHDRKASSGLSSN